MRSLPQWNPAYRHLHVAPAYSEPNTAAGRHQWRRVWLTLYWDVGTTHYTPEISHGLWKMMVGRWVSFWDCLFLGAMLNFRGVYTSTYECLKRFLDPTASSKGSLPITAWFMWGSDFSVDVFINQNSTLQAAKNIECVIEATGSSPRL